jgi:hypothetical protein
MKIFVDQSKLTDGSYVYAVRLTRFEDMPRSIDTLVIDAVTLEDAVRMATEMHQLINRHSTEEATLIGYAIDEEVSRENFSRCSQWGS